MTFDEQYTRFRAVDPGTINTLAVEARLWMENLPDYELGLLWNKFGDTAIFDHDAVIEMMELEEYDLPTDGMHDDSIDEDFMIWERGTDRMEIWHWFDEHLSMGLGKFLNRGETRVFPNIRKALLIAVDTARAEESTDALDEAIMNALRHACDQIEKALDEDKYYVPQVNDIEDYDEN